MIEGRKQPNGYFGSMAFHFAQWVNLSVFNLPFFAIILSGGRPYLLAVTTFNSQKLLSVKLIAKIYFANDAIHRMGKSSAVSPNYSFFVKSDISLLGC